MDSWGSFLPKCVKSDFRILNSKKARFNLFVPLVLTHLPEVLRTYVTAY